MIQKLFNKLFNCQTIHIKFCNNNNKQSCQPSADMICGHPPTYVLAYCNVQPWTFWSQNWHTG